LILVHVSDIQTGLPGHTPGERIPLKHKTETLAYKLNGCILVVLCCYQWL